MQVSLGRLINVMSIEEEKYGKKVIKHIQTIEVNNLDFVLDKRVILKNFSYKFRRETYTGLLAKMELEKYVNEHYNRDVLDTGSTYIYKWSPNC